MDEQNKEKIEKEVLDNLKNVLPQDNIDSIRNAFESQLNLFPENTKLISCKREIVFSITANVLEEDEQGKNMGSVEIVTQTYHMPVPEDKDYNDFMKAFVGFFEKTMIESHQHADASCSKETESKTDE